MKASIQNLIQEVTAVVFENDELDFWNMSELKSFLSPSSNFDLEIKFWDA